MIFSENVQVYDLFIIYHTEKNVILSVENLSTLIVLKSKFKLRAQNERYETYKIKNKFLRHFLNYFEGFFLYNFKFKTNQEKLRRKSEDNFHKESIGQILNKICIAQRLPAPENCYN